VSPSVAEQRRSLLWLALAIVCVLSELASASPVERRGEPARFELVHATGEYSLEIRRGETTRRVPVPAEWLTSPRAVDEELIVDGLPFQDAVDAFPIGDGRTGLHLASYEIQEAGSTMAAAGRDVFLVYDPDDGTLTRGGPALGMSQGRARYMGCIEADQHRFWIGDVNGDGLVDIGESHESIGCISGSVCSESDEEPSEEPGALAPSRIVHHRGPIRWHLFTGDGWTDSGDERFEGHLPPDMRALPLLAVEKGPVDFVWDVLVDRPESGTRARAAGTRTPGRQARRPPRQHWLVLRYADFGPQRLAGDLLGPRQWQWADSEAPDPAPDIRVVVYRGRSLERMRRRFPVQPLSERDFRYVEYDDALAYLRREVDDRRLHRRLYRTRNRILAALGEPRSCRPQGLDCRAFRRMLASLGPGVRLKLVDEAYVLVDASNPKVAKANLDLTLYPLSGDAPLCHRATDRLGDGAPELDCPDPAHRALLESVAAQGAMDRHRIEPLFHDPEAQ